MIHKDCGGRGVIPIKGGGAMTCIPCGGTGQVVEPDFVRQPFFEGADCPEPGPVPVNRALPQTYLERLGDWPRL